MSVLSWADVKELDIAEEREKCAFEVKRENLHSDINGLSSKYKLVSVKMPDEKDFVRLGEIHANRPFIPYPDAMDWINKQLDAVNVDYKLFRSEIEPKSKALFQQYMLGVDVTSPDGNSISPMLILRASYQGWRPALEIHVGTYRFVCSNGAIVSAGNVSGFRMNCHNWTHLQQVGISNHIAKVLDDLDAVAAMYKSLDQMSLSDKYQDIFSAKAFSISLRKKVLSALERDGVVEITKEIEEKKNPTLKAPFLEEIDLKPERVAGSVAVIEDKKLWDVYNVFTNTTTLGSSHSAKFIADSQKVNKVFSKMIA